MKHKDSLNSYGEPCVLIFRGPSPCISFLQIKLHGKVRRVSGFLCDWVKVLLRNSSEGIWFWGHCYSLLCRKTGKKRKGSRRLTQYENRHSEGTSAWFSRMCGWAVKGGFCSLVPSAVDEQIRYHCGWGQEWKLGQHLHGQNWIRIPKIRMWKIRAINTRPHSSFLPCCGEPIELGQPGIAPAKFNLFTY